MPRFYCPDCWLDFEKDYAVCPSCSFEIREFWSSKDYVEKLIVSLRHPEQSTPVRAAWLLGKIKDPRAVAPLCELVETAPDVFIARAAVGALGEIDTPESRRFLESLTNHPDRVVRNQVRKILASKRAPSWSASATCKMRKECL